MVMIERVDPGSEDSKLDANKQSTSPPSTSSMRNSESFNS